MRLEFFEATCPFEIGDKVKSVAGTIHEITNIVTVHYLKTGATEFGYELDNNGKFVELKTPLGSGNSEQGHTKTVN